MSLVFHSLFSGSSGNASLVCGGDECLLVDAGLSGKAILSAITGLGIKGTEVTGILVTHEHSDHIRGVGVLSRKFDIPIYASPGTWSGMEGSIGEIPFRNRRVFMTDSDFYIGNIAVTPFAIPHDAQEPVGYTFCMSGCRIGLATDMGHVTDTIIDRLLGCKMLLMEANHDINMLQNGPYPAYLKRRILGRRGHLSNHACGEALFPLLESGLECVYLGHLSRENNTPDLAFRTVCDTLRPHGYIPGKNIRVEMTHRDRSAQSFAV